MNNLNTYPAQGSLAANGSPLPMSIVDRDDIPSITSINIDGDKHSLGLVKDFRKNPLLASFLPEKPERVSFSWVRLLKGETLAVHSHPTGSLIIVSDGDGYYTGEINGRLKAGSIVIVPPNHLHGFCGAGENGFWALSIQTESLGLYENVATPRVSFKENRTDADNIDLLLQAHEFFMQDFASNEFFSLLESKEIKDTDILERFLDHLQYFSTRFQDVLKRRVQHASTDLELALASDHLAEEKDHDTNFAKYRGNPELGNIDAELIEISDWFEQSMVDLSESEKTVLMHFVLEGSGELAHRAVMPAVAGLAVSKHFSDHHEEDEGHFLMGVDALKEMQNLDIDKLLTVLLNGWSKLNQMCTCMARAALQHK